MTGPAEGDDRPGYGPDKGLDPALDPDRFVADPAHTRSVSPDVGSLDPRHDPDRFSNAVDTDGKDLTELIGKARSFEEERSPWTWLLGLAMVLGFLAIVSLVFANLSPR